MRRVAWSALPFAIAAWHWWRFDDRLPERMATHFDLAGRPNGFMSRGGFFAFYFGLLAFMALTFFGIAALIRRVPPHMVSLPDRDYWLAPERREATMTWLAADCWRFGLVVLLFVNGIHELVLRTNVAGGPLPGLALWLGVGGMLACTAFWLIRMMRRFRRPRD
jgi:hypothetical protein